MESRASRAFFEQKTQNFRTLHGDRHVVQCWDRLDQQTDGSSSTSELMSKFRLGTSRKYAEKHGVESLAPDWDTWPILAAAAAIPGFVAW